MSTLPALLALAIIAAPSKPTSPLEGCEAIQVDHGWQYECADVRARLEDRPEHGDKAGQYLAAMSQAAPAIIGDGSKTRTEKRKLGGSDVEVLVTEAVGQPVAAFLVGIPHQTGTRVLACNGENRRCASVMSSLAEMPWGSANAQGSIRKDPRTVRDRWARRAGPGRLQVLAAAPGRSRRVREHELGGLGLDG
jgi:hypothetical protein